ncbi:MAG: DAK2 domain-containing protein [Geminicoccaceae bacterium]
MDAQTLAQLVDAMHGTINGHIAQLDALDEAIGDGDHGTNLARGLDAVLAERQRLIALPLGDALQEAGWIVERETGGDGGTYYGLLLKAAGAAAPAGAPSPDELFAMLQAGIEAVQAKGGARKGEKTMLDVLIPVAQGMRSVLASGRTEQLGGRIIAAAAHGLHATTHMQAKHGLAADLGVASVNRMDAGACSCALLFGAIVGALENGLKAA